MKASADCKMAGSTTHLARSSWLYGAIRLRVNLITIVPVTLGNYSRPAVAVAAAIDAQNVAIIGRSEKRLQTEMDGSGATKSRELCCR